MHMASLGSSSSIENEHAVVNFQFTSCLFILLSRVLIHRRRNKIQYVTLLYLLLSARILRSRNQIINFGRLNALKTTTESDAISVLSTASILSLPTEYMIALIWGVGIAAIWYFYPILLLSLAPVLFSTGMICCGWHHLLEHGDSRLTMDVDINSVAHGAYACILGLVILSYRSRHTAPMYWELALWVLSALLHRTSNLFTLCLIQTQMFAVRIYCASVAKVRGPHMFQSSQLVVWLSHCAFYALGNSHVIATIDISKAYTGLTFYHQGIVGMLTFVITYNGYILVWMIGTIQIVQYSVLNCPKYKRKGAYYFAFFTVAVQLLHLVVYMIIVYVMRYHLFIWSVFAPKLLYATTICLIVLTSISIMLAVV